MANINSTVRFIGDASSLLNAYRQIRSEASATQRQINASGAQAFGATAQRAGVPLAGNQGVLIPSVTQNLQRNIKGIQAVYDTARPYISGIKTDMDLLNQSFVTTATIAKRAADGTELFRTEIQQVHGDIGQWMALETVKNNAIATGNQLLRANGQAVRNARLQWQPFRDTVESASRALYGPRQLMPDPTRGERLAVGRTADSPQLTARIVQPQVSAFDTTGSRGFSGGLLGRINMAQAARNARRTQMLSAVAERDAKAAYINSLDRIVTPDARGRLQTVYRDPNTGARVSMRAQQQQLAELTQIAARRDQLFQRSNARLGTLHREAANLQNQIASAQTGAAAASAQAGYQQALGARASIQQSIATRLGAIGTQQKATELLPTPPTQLATTLAQQSPAAFNKLQTLGVPLVGEGSRAFAEQASITKDLTHGISTLNSTYKDTDGIIKSATVSWDRNGVVVTKFNSHLSGLQNWLKQTSTNLQKVVQWGIATSLVLGAANFLQNTVSNVIELEKTLQRFSLTAQMSDRQTKEFFSSLADVAYKTATPLNELVSAADDIALATRKAGQSTEDWQQSILELSNSVGILTNLTGMDTVKATDVLTSSMKQLDLNANQLVGVLNKVTAVGGGQSVAIADIIEGLGNMAEAASQAGLSLDETIATVQVLSQVTSKSSKEVATSFKNLTGSLDSPGAMKMLDKYNIALKDEEGNLRNILEVYKDINEAIANGTIKAGDVKAVVKAIAGGPRRAPDAAALLGAVDQIDQVTQRAANATNEAIMANARVLDTMAAKITQLKVKFDELAYSKFGEGIKGGIEAIIGIMTRLLGLLENMNPALVGMVLQFGVLVVGLKLASATLRFFWGTLKELAAGYDIVTAKALLATNAIREQAIAATMGGAANQAAGAALRNQLFTINGVPIGGTPPTPKPMGPLGVLKNAGKVAFSRSNMIGAGAALAIGATAMAATSATNTQQDLGGLIAGLGTLALVAPVPIPHIKALGVGLLAAGTAMSLFTGKTQEATKEIVSNRQELLTAIDAHIEAQRTIADLVAEQSQLKSSFSKLSETEKDRIANSEFISANLERQGEITLSLVEANKQLEESYKSLSGQELKGYETQLKLAKAGAYSKESLKALSVKIAKDIFSETNPEFKEVFGKKTPKLTVTPFLETAGAASAVSKKTIEDTSVSPSERYVTSLLAGAGAVAKTKDQVEFLNEAALKTVRVLELFDSTGTKMTGEFSNNVATIDAMRVGLEAAAAAEGEVGERGKVALQTFNEQVAAMDAFTKITKFADFQKISLQAQSMTGLLKPEQADIGQNNLSLLTTAFAATSKLPTLKDIGLPANGLIPQQYPVASQEGAQQALIKMFTDTEGNIKTGKISLDQARDLMDIIGATNEHKVAGIALTDQQAASLAKGLGIQVELNAELEKQITNQEELFALQESLSALSGSVLEDYSQRNLEIQKQFKSGDITEAMRNSMLKASESTKVLQDRVIGLIDSFNQVSEAKSLFAMLQRLPGLESLVGKNAAEASAQLINWIGTMDLTSKQANKLKEYLQTLAGWAIRLSAIKTRFNVDVNLPTKELLNFLKALRLTMAAAQATMRANLSLSRRAIGAVGLAGVSNKLKEIDAAIAATQGALKAERQATNYVNSIQGMGSGGTGGGGSSSRGGKDYSELDIPEEIASALNRSSLIKQAIRDARALQKKIPGAAKEGKNDVVTLLNGMQKLETVRGIREDLLRRALDNLAEQERKRLEFETKADMIRRIRVGAGDWSAIANVPVNSKTGVSVGGNGAANVTLNLNGTVLTPAQFQEFANMIAAALKRQLAS